MLLFNQQLVSLKYMPAGGEVSAVDNTDNAKVLPRNVELKADNQTPEANRPDDYSRAENRQTLLNRDAQKAIQELRGVNLNKEADALQRSVVLAQQNETLDNPHTNKEAVAKNVRAQVDRALSDPLVRAAERTSLYNVQAKEAVASLRAQGKAEEAAALERSVKMASENETAGTPYINKLEAARGIRNIVDNALAGAMVGVEKLDTIAVEPPPIPDGEVKLSSVPQKIRNSIGKRFFTDTPVGVTETIRIGNVVWSAKKVSDRKIQYTKRTV